MKANIVLGLLVLLVLGAAFVLWPRSSNAPVITDTNTQVSTTTTGGNQTTQIKIALLDTTGTGTGKSVGCDNLVMATRTVPATTSVLTTALNTLFAEPEGSQPSTAYNFIARTKSTLQFDHAMVANGTASIYLTGKLSGLAGVCDDPRAKIQIEETAKQFATVQNVVIYLNGKANGLDVSEKGE
jgi:hypothetical protein